MLLNATFTDAQQIWGRVSDCLRLQWLKFLEVESLSLLTLFKSRLKLAIFIGLLVVSTVMEVQLIHGFIRFGLILLGGAIVCYLRLLRARAYLFLLLLLGNDPGSFIFEICFIRHLVRFATSWSI